jgi:hypothetical protein
MSLSRTSFAGGRGFCGSARSAPRVPPDEGRGRSFELASLREGLERRNAERWRAFCHVSVDLRISRLRVTGYGLWT